MTWAFSDESERGSTMYVGVVVVPTGSLHEARRVMRAMLLPGQRRLHMAKEGQRRRRAILDAAIDLRADAHVLSARRELGVSRIDTRAHLLRAAAAVASESAVWELDAQDDAQLHRDRLLLEVAFSEGGPAYDHRPSHEEPMLWVVDAMLWAFGVGGEMRRRVAPSLTHRRI